MICLVWEWGIFGTLSLDFPVLAEEEIVWGNRPWKGLQGVPGLRAGPGHRSRTPHSGQSVLLLPRKHYLACPGGRPLKMEGALDNLGQIKNRIPWGTTC